MKKFLIFLFGFVTGGFLAFIFLNSGMGNNSGSEFYGNEYLDIIKNSRKGLGNNAGSKFYSDSYLREKYREQI